MESKEKSEQQRERYNISQRKWRNKNSSKVNSAGRRYYQKNKDKDKNSKLKIKYGITLEQYEVMLEQQKGCCKICKTPQNELKRNLAVDHCHNTGQIRGLLCHKCNTLIGSAKESKEILLKVIEYLSNFTQQ